MKGLPVGTLHTFMVKVGLGDTSDHMVVVAISLFVTLLCACIVLGHMLEENRWLSESITAIILVSYNSGILGNNMRQGTNYNPEMHLAYSISFLWGP